jgi:hypothetical protein
MLNLIGTLRSGRVSKVLAVFLLARRPQRLAIWIYLTEILDLLVSTDRDRSHFPSRLSMRSFRTEASEGGFYVRYLLVRFHWGYRQNDEDSKT